MTRPAAMGIDFASCQQEQERKEGRKEEGANTCKTLNPRNNNTSTLLPFFRHFFLVEEFLPSPKTTLHFTPLDSDPNCRGSARRAPGLRSRPIQPRLRARPSIAGPILISDILPSEKLRRAAPPVPGSAKCKGRSLVSCLGPVVRNYIFGCVPRGWIMFPNIRSTAGSKKYLVYLR